MTPPGRHQLWHVVGHAAVWPGGAPPGGCTERLLAPGTRGGRDRGGGYPEGVPAPFLYPLCGNGFT